MTQLGERGRGEKERERRGQTATTAGVMRDSFSARLAAYKRLLLPREGCDDEWKVAALASNITRRARGDSCTSARGSGAAVVPSPRAQSDNKAARFLQ